MLTTALPPLPFRYGKFPELQAEALACTLLASYSDQVQQPRVTTAFQRAYGATDFFRFPFINNGRPGFVITKWDTPHVKKAVVSIEGTRTWLQILNWYYLTTRRVYSWHPGRACELFAAYADDIWTALMANADWLQIYGNPAYPLTFTGHSLGAGIAEILAERVSYVDPSRNVKCIKFGSPRVGSFRWANGRSNRVDHQSLYTFRDPIDIFPACIPPALSLRQPSFGDTFFPLAHDVAADRYRMNGEPTTATFWEGGCGQAAAMVRAARRTMDRDNVWSDHQLKYYHFMMLNKHCKEDNFQSVRFRYLEFNDLNNFGLGWIPGVEAITDAMETFLDPQPAEVEYQPTQEELDAASRNGLFSDAELGFFDADTHVGSMIGGGDDDPRFGRLDNLPTTPTRITAPAPTTFVPHPTGARRRR